MKRVENLSVYDSSIRAIIGFILLNMTAMGFMGLFGLFGLLLFATAYAQHCPVYGALGLSSIDNSNSTENHAHPAE